MVERIQRKRTKGWRMPENAVYVGRPTKYGNPIAVAADGWIRHADGRGVVLNGHLLMYSSRRDPPRQYLVSAFEAWLDLPEQAALRAAAKKELARHDLACWCPLTEPCHADVWLKVVNP